MDLSVGFEVPLGFEEFVQFKHFGLAGMAERVAIISGELKIDSHSGSGTIIRLTIPTGAACVL